MAAEFAIGPADLLASPEPVLEHLWNIACARWDARAQERQQIEESQRQSQFDRMHARLRGGG